MSSDILIDTSQKQPNEIIEVEEFEENNENCVFINKENQQFNQGSSGGNRGNISNTSQMHNLMKNHQHLLIRDKMTSQQNNYQGLGANDELTKPKALR